VRKPEAITKDIIKKLVIVDIAQSWVNHVKYCVICLLCVCLLNLFRFILEYIYLMCNHGTMVMIVTVMRLCSNVEYNDNMNLRSTK
jgi:hypothetical protein